MMMLLLLLRPPAALTPLAPNPRARARAKLFLGGDVGQQSDPHSGGQQRDPRSRPTRWRRDPLAALRGCWPPAQLRFSGILFSGMRNDDVVVVVAAAAAGRAARFSARYGVMENRRH